MNREILEFQVYFSDPFWVGVWERMEDGAMSVCKVTFGPEPKDYELWQYILEQFYRLSFSAKVAVVSEERGSMNPKRMQREVKKQLRATGIGTKSQQILQMQHEQDKMERKDYNRQQKEEEIKRRFHLRQQKKKEKHRGR